MARRTRSNLPQVNEQDTQSEIGSDMNDLDLNTLSSEDINRDAINRLETKVNTQFEKFETQNSARLEKLEDSNAELKSMLKQLLQQSSIVSE